MRKAYLLQLKIFDSKDAYYPLNYEKVTELKISILLEFLRLSADEYIAVELFGDLATPSEVYRTLALVPEPAKFKISQSDPILKKTIDEYSVEEAVDFAGSSNPVETERPVFLVVNNGTPEVIESAYAGCVAVEVAQPTVVKTGQLGYLSRFVEKSEAAMAELFGNKVAFVCDVSLDNHEKRIAEKLSQEAVCCFLMLSQISRGEWI